MRLLLGYLRRHWPLVILALVLASINQIFSLLDPAIFRHVIDDYVTKAGDFAARVFIVSVSLPDARSRAR